MRIPMLTLFVGAALTAQDHQIKPALKEPHYPLACSLNEKTKARSILADMITKKTLSPSDINTLKALGQNLSYCPDTFAEQDVVALMRWHQILPCDPTKFKTPVDVLLKPERHDQQDKESYLATFEELRTGQAYVAYETGLSQGAGIKLDSVPERYRENFNTTADGSLAYGCTGVGACSRSPRSGATQKMIMLAMIVAQSPEIQIGMKKAVSDKQNIAKTEPEKKSAKEMKLTLDTVLEIAKDQEMWSLVTARKQNVIVEKVNPYVENLAKSLGGKFSPGEPSQILDETIKNLIAEAVANVKELLNNPRTQFLNLSPTVGTEQLPKPPELYPWRNRNMAATVAQMICEAGKNGIGKVYLHFGAAHLKGVSEILKQTIEKNDAGKAIQLNMPGR